VSAACKKSRPNGAAKPHRLGDSSDVTVDVLKNGADMKTDEDKDGVDN
jgi:hypothetical protein